MPFSKKKRQDFAQWIYPGAKFRQIFKFFTFCYYSTATSHKEESNALKIKRANFKNWRCIMKKIQPHRNTLSWQFHSSHKLNWKPNVKNNSAHFLQLHVWGNDLSDKFQWQRMEFSFQAAHSPQPTPEQSAKHPIPRPSQGAWGRLTPLQSICLSPGGVDDGRDLALSPCS